MANWSQSNWSLKSWNNRARSFVGRDAAAEAAAEAERLAQEAAALARRAADDADREYWEHHAAQRAKAYRAAAIAARATAELAATPQHPALPPQTADVVPSPELVRAAVERLRNVRTSAPRREGFGGGINLPAVVPWK
jgi:hypothetical protein